MRRAELKRHTAAFSDGGGELSVSSPAATEWHLFFFWKGITPRVGSRCWVCSKSGSEWTTASGLTASGLGTGGPAVGRLVKKGAARHGVRSRGWAFM